MISGIELCYTVIKLFTIIRKKQLEERGSLSILASMFLKFLILLSKKEHSSKWCGLFIMSIVSEGTEASLPIPELLIKIRLMYEWLKLQISRDWDTKKDEQQNPKFLQTEHMAIWKFSTQMHSFTLETIFHKETKINKLAQVIRTNIPKEMRMNGDGKSILLQGTNSSKTSKWSPGTNSLNKHQWQDQN